MELKLYKVLDLHQGATQEEVKKQYFKLAKMYHPDVNKTKEAKKKYLEINE